MTGPGLWEDTIDSRFWFTFQRRNPQVVKLTWKYWFFVLNFSLFIVKMLHIDYKGRDHRSRE
ncbi:hypothetical protein PRUPE_1G462600 [Prunus persica]|uniref:Uncharacterized protein n=1 Tax=Prunus persica TaxID=3760 RepID=A0A251RDS4_PRUPE|nr:hypothetical protein PRUPE_1G462600 [Prunus persica]